MENWYCGLEIKLKLRIGFIELTFRISSKDQNFYILLFKRDINNFFCSLEINDNYTYIYGNQEYI